VRLVGFIKKKIITMHCRSQERKIQYANCLGHGTASRMAGQWTTISLTQLCQLKEAWTAEGTVLRLSQQSC
jgi:hypothetical protein